MRQGRDKITQEEYEKREKELSSQFNTDAITEQEYNQARKDLKKLDPKEGWLFDDNEPEWMAKVTADARKHVFDELTGSSRNYKLQNGGGIVSQVAIIILGLGGMGILNVAVWGISKGAFKSGNSVPLAIMATTSLGIMYLMYTSSKDILDSDERTAALIGQYKDKSMQYMLREAHTKGIIKDLDIPRTI